MAPFFLLHILLLSAAVALPPRKAFAAPPTTAALRNCPTQCGDVDLPFPFGFRTGCYLHGFQVECNSSFSTPMIHLPGTELARNKVVSVSNISLDTVTVQLGVLASCGSGIIVKAENDSAVSTSISLADLNILPTELEGSPYTLSNTRNNLVVLGCYSIGQVFTGVQPAAACTATCINEKDIVNDSCTVLSGCCQSILPKSMKDFNLVLAKMDVGSMNDTYKQVSKCSYAFLTDTQQYIFRTADLYDYYRSRGSWSVPVVLDWAIANYNCSMATTLPEYACGTNTICVDSTNGPGYRCNCSNGYTGNPYLADGCQDINECEDPKENTCSDMCENTLGGFTCSCPIDTFGDGLKEGKGCIHNQKSIPLIQIILGSGISLLLVLVSFSYIYWFMKKRKLVKLRKKFFEKNGGWILNNIISQDSGAQIPKLFTEHELIKATDNYSKKAIIGKGGFGTVYKGVLQDMSFVAIKKSKIEEEGQVVQFINEIVILSQIKHRNVVKLLGCCLDSKVPLLIYEYIPNGTLFYHLHDPDRVSSLSWQARLRIVVEIADAISYLHSFASQPILHRDIKSSNILLDDNYCAKVSDFGISKIISLGEFDETTMLQGTWGYIDPESFETGQLTMKSDVYSFGVILAEILTGCLPILIRNGENISLASLVAISMREDNLFEVLEPRVLNECNLSQLQEIVNLTSKCLREKGEERPSMRDIAAQLNALQSIQVPRTYQSIEEVHRRCITHSFNMSHYSVLPSTMIGTLNIDAEDSRLI